MIYKLNYISYLAGSAAEEVAEQAIEMINDHQYHTLAEAIDGEVDRWLIWDDNRWQIMKEYQDPESANYHEALEEFYNDVCVLILEVEEEDEAIAVDIDGDTVEIVAVIDYQDAEEKSAEIYYNGDEIGVNIAVRAGSSFESYLYDEAGAAELAEIQDLIREIQAEERKEAAIIATARYYLDTYRQGLISDLVNSIMDAPVFTVENWTRLSRTIESEEEALGEAADLLSLIFETIEIAGVNRFFKYKKENDLTECSYFISEGCYLNCFYYNDHLLAYRSTGSMIEDWKADPLLEAEIRIYDYELNEEIEHFDL